MKLYLKIGLFSGIIYSCNSNNTENLQQKTNDKELAFKLFNEGVSLSMSAIEEEEKGDFEKAENFNKEAILKFKETLELDSAHEGARSALGHSLYVNGQFKEAIYWFRESNEKIAKEVQNFRELGLCKINLGEIKEGKADIDIAFAMDTSHEIRNLTLNDLTDLGQRAFEYGEEYVKKGNDKKGLEYKIFAFEVLKVAYDYDSSRSDIALTISKFAQEMGEPETALRFKRLAEGN